MESLLRQVARRMGLDENAVVAVASASARRIGRTRAGWEVRYKNEQLIDEWRREQIRRESQRMKTASQIELVGVPIGTKSIVVLRQRDEIVVWQLRERIRRTKPKTKKVIAQNLPSHKVKSLEVELVIVLTPTRTSVLTLQSKTRSVSLPLNEPPTQWFLRLENGTHVVPLNANSIDEAREKLKRIQKLPIASRLLISNSLEHWSKVSELYLP